VTSVNPVQRNMASREQDTVEHHTISGFPNRPENGEDHRVVERRCISGRCSASLSTSIVRPAAGGGKGREQQAPTQRPSAGTARTGATHPPDALGRRDSQTKGHNPTGTSVRVSLSCRAEESRRTHAPWGARSSLGEIVAMKY
jgi:hypothetical protein